MRFTRSVRTPFDSVAWTAASAAGEISTRAPLTSGVRSEEHTSELQSLRHLVCRLLLEKKNRVAEASQKPVLGFMATDSWPEKFAETGDDAQACRRQFRWTFKPNDTLWQYE